MHTNSNIELSQEAYRNNIAFLQKTYGKKSSRQ
jgi:hypothetical protein